MSKKKKKKISLLNCKPNQKLIRLLSVSHRFRLTLKGWIGSSAITIPFTYSDPLRHSSFIRRVQYNIDCCAQLILLAGRLYSLSLFFSFLFFFRFFASTLDIATIIISSIAPNLPAYTPFCSLPVSTLFVALFS